MVDAFIWYLILMAIAIGHLPLTVYIFSHLIDSGWAFGRIVATLSISYLVWLTVSLKIIPFNHLIFPLILGEIIIIWVWSIKAKIAVLQTLREKRKVIMIEELIFLILFTIYLIIRSSNPHIQGLEKFMDFGFVNSILNSQTFPPLDMWFAGHSINYYYFGHLITAVLTKISFIPPTITYNLQLATVFASTSLGAFTIILTLTKNYLAAIASFIFLGIIGNLHPVTILKTGFKNYWYATASRLDPFIINEFPSYSFVVADLHAHLLDLPIVVLIIGILTQLIISQYLPFLTLGLLTLAIGATYATNSWDYPIYLFLSSIVIFLINLEKTPKMATIFSKILPVLFILSAGSMILFLPFHLNFKPLTFGIGLVTSRSTLSMLLTMWGFWLFLGLSFSALLLLKMVNFDKPTQLILIFLLTAIILIIVPEVIYIKDIYANNYYRANTVFKFYYQAWVLLSLMGSFTLAKMWQVTIHKLSVYKIVWWVALGSFLLIVASYPVLAVKSFYSVESTQRSLDGGLYLLRLNQEDYQAILWLKKHTPKKTVVVEAVGDSYTDYGRIAVFSGRPTIMGWPVHEWLWRGSFNEPSRRIQDVALIYTSSDIPETKAILNQYQAKYVVIGNLEREKYPTLNEAKFAILGTPVFRYGQTTIFKIN